MQIVADTLIQIDQDGGGSQFGFVTFMVLENHRAIDLDAASLDDIRQFFETWYAPDNAGNVWNAGTLEWLPSGNYATRSIPIVTSRDPLWDQPQLAEVAHPQAEVGQREQADPAGADPGGGLGERRRGQLGHRAEVVRVGFGDRLALDRRGIAVLGAVDQRGVGIGAAVDQRVRVARGGATRLSGRETRRKRR